MVAPPNSAHPAHSWVAVVALKHAKDDRVRGIARAVLVYLGRGGEGRGGEGRGGEGRGGEGRGGEEGREGREGRGGEGEGRGGGRGERERRREEGDYHLKQVVLQCYSRMILGTRARSSPPFSREPGSSRCPVARSSPTAE